MIIFMLVILGAISFASFFGLQGLWGFLLLTTLSALLLRARQLRRI